MIYLKVQTFWPPFGRRAEFDESEEDRLVAAAKYGDPDAFDVLVERYAPRLHAVAKRFVGDDLAPDIVQDAFLAAHKSLRKFRGAASFSTWLHKIVINRCQRVAKQQKIHAPLVFDVADKDTSPHHKAENRQLRERLEQALSELPEQFRLTLSLREFSELSYAEIAEVLEVSEGTVKSRIARARGMLKDILLREGIDV